MQQHGTHLLDSLSLGKIVQIRERILKAQANGKKVFRFESGDPNFSLAPHVIAALKKAADEGKTHYIPNAGIPELRNAIHKKLSEKNGIHLPSVENVFVTNGAMHALFCAFQCLLQPGDEVIVPDPMWTEVVENIKVARGTPVAVPLSEESGFQYLPAEIEKRITNKTKVIFLNTPHNPTGAVLPVATLREIIRLAKAHGLWIVSDEAYEDVIFPPQKHVSIASLAPDYQNHIVSVFSFSKSHAMSGLRTGYLTATDETLMERLHKIMRCSINGVNSVAQWTAVAALQGDQTYVTHMLNQYITRRDIMIEALTGIPGLKPFVPQGSFFVWATLDKSIYARLGVKDADDLSNTLAELGMGSSPGDAFGQTCADAIRFSFSCSTEMVKEGSLVLRQLLTGGRLKG
jgi:aspartate aminotransferase